MCPDTTVEAGSNTAAATNAGDGIVYYYLFNNTSRQLRSAEFPSNRDTAASTAFNEWRRHFHSFVD